MDDEMEWLLQGESEILEEEHGFIDKLSRQGPPDDDLSLSATGFARKSSVNGGTQPASNMQPRQTLHIGPALAFAASSSEGITRDSDIPQQGFYTSVERDTVDGTSAGSQSKNLVIPAVLRRIETNHGTSISGGFSAVATASSSAMPCTDSHVDGGESGKCSAAGSSSRQHELPECGPMSSNVHADGASFPPPHSAIPCADDVYKARQESMKPKNRAHEINGKCVAVTGPSGQRVYLHIVQADEGISTGLQGVARDGSGGRKPEGNLLGEPIERFMARVEMEHFRRALESSELASSATNGTPRQEVSREELWVEKYAPKAFTDLLSDEHINREVLRWLKQWDRCVFGETRTATSAEALTALRRASLGPSSGSGRGWGRLGHWNQGSGVHGRGGGGSFVVKDGGAGATNTTNREAFPRNGDWDRPKGAAGGLSYDKPSEDVKGANTGGPLWDKRASIPTVVMDADGERPADKVLLLCGAPGLGKTTLAHVAARHCGYRVVEVNASDDRSASTLRTRILDAVQMQPVMGDRRPNCLVIDEIDGVSGGAEGKGAIDALLDIVLSDTRGPAKGKENEGEGKEQTPKKKKGRRNGGVKRLSRPVICICNDLYAPVLRSLRQVAKIFVFSQPSISRVANRLKTICSLENFKTDMRGLNALSEHTECDIRACLNTLQFLKQKGTPLSEADVDSQVVGRKDMTKSMFDVWQEVFQKKRVRPGRATEAKSAELGRPGKAQKEEDLEWSRVYSLVSNHGEYDFLLDGIHENLHNGRFHDSSLLKTVDCFEWMCISDVWSRHIISRSNFSLALYQPTAILGVRQIVVGTDRPQLEWPKSHARFRSDLSTRQEVLATWMQKMAPIIVRTTSLAIAALDLITPVLTILAPLSLRPVAPQLLTKKEKEEVTELVDTMITLGVRYSTKGSTAGGLMPSYNSGSMDFQQNFPLEPAITIFIQYKEYTPQHRQLSTALRQMLAHEVDLETIRREAVAHSARTATSEGANRNTSYSEHLASKDKHPTKTNPLSAFSFGNSTKLNQNPGSGGASSASGANDSLKRVRQAPGNQQGITETRNGREGEKRQKRDDGGVESGHKPAVKLAFSTDFFARFKKASENGDSVTQKTSASSSSARSVSTSARDSLLVLYKFHEGFTNAVKRPVHLRDFL